VGIEGDLSLAVNPPLNLNAAWPRPYNDRERNERLPHLETFVDEIGQRQTAGQSVAIADVAFANGADPTLINLLSERGVSMAGLAAYGGWNTAGNTIGVALAQACAVQQIRSDDQRDLQQQFLLRRLLEDWGYQAIVREQAADWLESKSGQREPTSDNLEETVAWIEARLQSCHAELSAFANRFRIVPGTVRLPWQRLFEVDFELESLPSEEIL
jgi:hypothetical protein